MKLLTIILLIASCALCSCGTKTNTDNNTATETNEIAEKTTESKDDTKKTETATDNYEIEVLSCSFKNGVTAQDEEYIASSYGQIDGKVYVDLALKIKNNSSEKFTKDSISGYFTYEDLRYDLQYALEAPSSIAFGSNELEPDTSGIVHLFTRADAAIESEDITVYYTVDGKDFEAKVEPRDDSDALSKKTEVSIGDKIDVDGEYAVEIVDCSVKKYIQASDYANSDQYELWSDGQTFDLILKVENKTANELKNICGYSIVNGEITRAVAGIETHDNTEIDGLDYNPLASGQSEYIHIYTKVDENVSTDDLYMRFNLGGNCYYCKSAQ